MIRAYAWIPLLGAGTLALPLMWAQQRQNWLGAQVCLVTIFLLLALAAWAWWQSENPPPEFSIAAATYAQAMQRLLRFVALGVAAVILNATRREHWEDGMVARAVGFSVLVAGSALISGALVGFLFGSRPVDSKTAGRHPQTNLEEIADWLTKIILGAGLVQLTHLPSMINRFSIYMADALGEYKKSYADIHFAAPPTNAPIALAILVFFSACGLLYGYLWTRYEAAAATDIPAADLSALAWVNRWLNDTPAPDNRMRAEMMNAVKRSSTVAKVKIFLQAEQYREASNEDEAINERTLPIFQALVEADTQEVFHRNRSQYAFALMARKKDLKNSAADRHHALDLLNDAIRIRDASREQGWRDYELARALCQIHLDANFNHDPKTPSNAEQRLSIFADLNKAKESRPAASNLNNQLIEDWEKLNGQ